MQQFELTSIIIRNSILKFNFRDSRCIIYYSGFYYILLRGRFEDIKTHFHIMRVSHLITSLTKRHAFQDFSKERDISPTVGFD